MSFCIDGLFSVKVHFHLSVQLCVQRVFDQLYEALEVVLLEKHCGVKLFRLTVLAKCACLVCLEAAVVVVFMVEVQRTDSYKQLERLLACLHPSDCIESLFSAQVRFLSSAQLCIQGVLDKLYEAFEVVVL